jgi:hypothetical protein
MEVVANEISHVGRDVSASVHFVKSEKKKHFV